MSDEFLSALIDGECTGTEVEQMLRTMEGSPELQRYWMRMCLAREVARGTQVRQAHFDFPERVMAAVAAEPSPATNAPATNVIPLPARGRRAWQPLVGLAAAAGLAAVAVVSVVQFNRSAQPGAQNPPATAIAGATDMADLMPENAGQGQEVLVSDDQSSVPDDQTMPADLRWAQVDSASAQQLTGYVIDHSNYRSTQGLGGLGYARVAAHFADYHPQGGQP